MKDYIVFITALLYLLVDIAACTCLAISLPYSQEAGLITASVFTLLGAPMLIALKLFATRSK